MGDLKVNIVSGPEEKGEFIEALLRDIRALERMVNEGLIESDIQRIGAEQELYLVDNAWRPAPVLMEVLPKIDDEHFTTELAKYNMEINLDPQVFEGDCLSALHDSLTGYLAIARKALKKVNARPMLVGILPTLKSTDVGTDNMTPIDRYYALDKVLSEMRGGDFEFRIDGIDELFARHNSVMFESCNTSFQLHFQVKAPEFVSMYNWAQAISGPVLSACTFSPMFLGRKLWRETRIALFQQSIDTRQAADLFRQISPRVTFGNQWVKESVIEIFQEDIVRHKIILNKEIKTNPLEILDEGKVPKLEALMAHNGTIYKWNRACYGITEGKPHIRIENRYLPSGPTIIDEVANSALWFGLMKGLPDKYKNLNSKLDFDVVKSNFVKAARQGLYSQFKWVDEKTYTAQDFMLNELLPIARDGLNKARIKEEDIDKYLGVIEDRVKSFKTGSSWILESYQKLSKKGTQDETLVAITAGISKRQQKDIPVHKWSYARIEEAGSWVNYYWRIDQVMSTDLYAVQDDDFVDLVASIMDWKKVRHVPVENKNGELVGLITSGLVVHYLGSDDRKKNLTIEDIMIRNPITVSPDTYTIEALDLMRKKKIGCLPVVKEKKLVGIVTEHDFVDISAQLFKEIMANERNRQ